MSNDLIPFHVKSVRIEKPPQRGARELILNWIRILNGFGGQGAQDGGRDLGV